MLTHAVQLPVPLQEPQTYSFGQDIAVAQTLLPHFTLPNSISLPQLGHAVVYSRMVRDCLNFSCCLEVLGGAPWNWTTPSGFPLPQAASAATARRTSPCLSFMDRILQ